MNNSEKYFCFLINLLMDIGFPIRNNISTSQQCEGMIHKKPLLVALFSVFML